MEAAEENGGGETGDGLLLTLITRPPRHCVDATETSLIRESPTLARGVDVVLGARSACSGRMGLIVN